MKSSSAAIAVLIVAAFCCEVSSATLALRSRGRCCLKFLDKALPPNKVMMYEYTGSSCPYPGIIFTTFEDRTCCANPDEKWVQDLLNVEKHKGGSK
ncbi:CCL4 protein, partial [Odontophorus gujanensis]|nr:CCL4 protein [Odontophorus gujanensis]